MEELICKECGKVFRYEKMSSCKAQLKRHLIENHHMNVEDYVVKYEYNGIHPKCPCGCGHDLKLKDRGKRWEFNKYYCDTCYGSLVRKCNAEVLKHYKDTHKRNFDITEYYESHYDKDTYQKAFDMLKSKMYPLSYISKVYSIDKRTIKKVWLGLGITNSEELVSLLQYNKYKLPSIENTNNVVNDNDVIVWCYNLIKAWPGKYTPNSLQDAYNDNHQDSKTKHSGYIITRNLYKIYGDEIEMYLADGLHSSEEYRFYEILRFYLTDYNVKLGKKFILESGYIYYDILIGSRLLIEYDSDGYFHKDENIKIKDISKEKFAKENGYLFLRLTKNDIKKVETIQKIQKILKKHETN